MTPERTNKVTLRVKIIRLSMEGMTSSYRKTNQSNSLQLRNLENIQTLHRLQKLFRKYHKEGDESKQQANTSLDTKRPVLFRGAHHMNISFITSQNIIKNT